MSFLNLYKQSSAPSTPAANKATFYIDNTTRPIFKMIDENGNIWQLLDANYVNAKGDLITATADNTPAILTAGANGKVLAYNSAALAGLAAVDPVVNQGSTASVSAGYAADTYLAGSALTIPTAGNWNVQTTCYWGFDMVKTGAGTATPILQVRMGTAGTTADTSIVTLTWAVGTAVVDTGWFDIYVNFRSVGSGTSAVIQAIGRCTHHLAATGLTTTGASGTGIIIATSAGFNSTTPTKIGLSFNGGASFSGTNTIVQARGFNINI